MICISDKYAEVDEDDDEEQLQILHINLSCTTGSQLQNSAPVASRFSISHLPCPSFDMSFIFQSSLLLCILHQTCHLWYHGCCMLLSHLFFASFESIFPCPPDKLRTSHCIRKIRNAIVVTLLPWLGCPKQLHRWTDDGAHGSGGGSSQPVSPIEVHDNKATIITSKTSSRSTEWDKGDYMFEIETNDYLMKARLFLNISLCWTHTRVSVAVGLQSSTTLGKPS